MLNETIKTLRKSKGLSQEELAARLHVVRQTVSKWENGLSVPDSNLLIALANELDTSVAALLGEPIETVSEAPENDSEKLRAISEKLEKINFQLAEKSRAKRRAIRWSLLFVCALIVLVFVLLTAINSPYLRWNYNDPEAAAAGTLLHGFEFLFVRVAPIVFVAAAIGVVTTYKKR